VHALAARIVLMMAIPALAAVIWGLFAAPRARFRLPVAGVLAVERAEPQLMKGHGRRPCRACELDL